MLNDNLSWQPKGLPLTNANYSSVALSANGLTAVVGVPEANNTRGQVQIYQWSNGTWMRTASVDGKSPMERFGNTLALSADGSTFAAATNSSERNTVRLYKSSVGNWLQQGEDLFRWGDQRFGQSLALSSDGSTVAIGIPQFDDANSYYSNLHRPEMLFDDMRRESKGAVQVYKWINNMWDKLGYNLIGKAARNQFGEVVTLSSSGALLVVSAPTAKQYSGVASIYKYQGANCVEVEAIKGESDNDNAGYALALSADGSRLVISTPFAHGGGYVRGQARVFRCSGDEWQQLGTTLNGQNDQDKFGESVAIAGENADTLVVSAYQDERSGVSNGYIRTFKWADGVWKVATADLIGASSEHLGTTVVLSADARTLATRSGNGTVRFYEAISNTISGFVTLRP